MNKNFKILKFNRVQNKMVNVLSIYYNDLNIGLIDLDNNSVLSLKIGKAMMNQDLIDDLAKLFEMIKKGIIK